MVFQESDPSMRVNLLDGLTPVADKYYTKTKGTLGDIPGQGVSAYAELFDVTAGETIYVGHLRADNTGVRTSAWDGEGAGWNLLYNQGGVLNGAFVIAESGKLCISVSNSASPYIVTRSQATYEAWLAQQES